MLVYLPLIDSFIIFYRIFTFYSDIIKIRSVCVKLPFSQCNSYHEKIPKHTYIIKLMGDEIACELDLCLDKGVGVGGGAREEGAGGGGSV